jgi:hypothetical protein
MQASFRLPVAVIFVVARNQCLSERARFVVGFVDYMQT